MVHLGKDKKLVRDNLYARDTMSKIYYDKVADIARERERLEKEKERLEGEKERLNKEKIEADKTEEPKSNTVSDSTDGRVGSDVAASLYMIAAIIVMIVVVFEVGNSLMRSGIDRVEKTLNESISSEYEEETESNESVVEEETESAEEVAERAEEETENTESISDKQARSAEIDIWDFLV